MHMYSRLENNHRVHFSYLICLLSRLGVYNVYMPEQAQGWHVFPRFGIDESSEHYDCAFLCALVLL